ncbi:MAG: hypothetical protein KTR31_16645 [Myxococcales bacterium]|nr:hypothetical protein [Myxococcales bacterium]
MQIHEERVLRAAQSAWDHTAVYRAIYGDRPEAVSDVPFIGHSRFHRARGLSDCVRDLDAVCSTVPPVVRDVRRIGVTVAEDETDIELRHERTVLALQDVGLTPESGVRSVLLVADDATGPLACELSAALGWERVRASIAYVHSGSDALSSDVEAYDPDVVISVSHHLTAAEARPWRRRWIEVRPFDGPMSPSSEEATLLVSDELHVVASRPAGRAWFGFDDSQLAAERHPRALTWALTRTRWGAFPLVRYASAGTAGLQLRGVRG